MKKFNIITTIRFLKTKGEIPDRFTLMPGVDLISDKKKIAEYIPRELQSIAGLIEYNHLLNSNHIVVCEADESIFPEPFDSNGALTLWLIWLDMLLNDSWLVKDNSMVCEAAYATMTDGEHKEWSSNYLAYTTSMSTGNKHIETHFNLEELTLWEQRSHSLQNYLHSKHSGALASFTNKEFSRIGRALHFIKAARRELHPAIKISHYCSSLESIFSTDSAELSHKLSERVALFLGKYGNNPSDVFDDIKELYGIRSKVTHGDSIQPKKENNLPILSEKADNYIRKTINIILSSKPLMNLFDGNKEQFEGYFKSLLFGRHQTE